MLIIQFSDTIQVLMFNCPTVSVLRFYGCCHPCYDISIYSQYEININFQKICENVEPLLILHCIGVNLAYLR